MPEQPKPYRRYLVDDLNDWLVKCGSTPVKQDTRMTVRELETLCYALELALRKSTTL